MESWKKALIAGSATTAAIMVLKGRTSLGVLFAGVSLATLASEYPEDFARFRRHLPDYIDRGTQFVDTAARLGERMAESAAGRGASWYESLLRN